MKLTWRIWVLVIALLLALLMIHPTFEQGIVIKSVEKNSTAFDNGLRAGMKIQEINSQKIESIQQYTIVASSFQNNSESRINIVTDEGQFTFLGEDISEITVGEIPRTKIKTGLDLSGGARALVKPVDVSLSDAEIGDLASITSQRLNAFGLTDLSVRSVRDLDGNNYMLIEIAGATTQDLKDIVGKQGKFEAKVGNQTVFEGGEKDISDVCRNDATCAAVTSCFPAEGGYACNFAFTIYLTQSAAKKHADTTRNLALDPTGKYLSEKLYLFVDDIEVDSLYISSGLRGQETTQIQIQGSGAGTTQQEALEDTRNNMNKLQTILLTGSLPYKLEVVKLDTISPLLGKEFSKSLIYLGAAVFLIVSIVIFIKYRRLNLSLAVILTMFSEAFITIGIAALLKWNLDAPALAGIIAGIGTGVGDQILILDETVKREGQSSLKERIKLAFFIIVGSFLTNVASMVPLFWTGAGMLKGFALTTIIGVSVGILVTRPAFADIIKKLEE